MLVSLDQRCVNKCGPCVMTMTPSHVSECETKIVLVTVILGSVSELVPGTFSECGSRKF